MEHGATGGAVLTQALVFLGATCLVIPALRRAKLSAVMGFLLIGVGMGPHVLGQMADAWPWLNAFELREERPTALLAELGVVFLLFIIGLEVSFERLWALKRYVFGLGLAQVVLSTIAIAGVALAFGNSFAAASVLGLAFALSSTALVLQLLREGHQIATPVGRISFSVLLMQDLMVVPILFLVAALGTDASSFSGHNVLFALFSALVSLTLIFTFGRVLLRPLFRWVASIDSREVFIAAAILAAIGMATAAQSAGLSMGLGAFLAGLLLAETEFRHQIETDLEPFKDLLLGLFFVTVGMQIDIALLLADPVMILIGVVGLFVIKIAIIAPLARVFGIPWPRAIGVAFLLGQAGEFAFVVIAVARGNGAIPEATADYMLLVTALSIFVTPFVAALGGRIARELANKDTTIESDLAQEGGHVVIAGFGRVGQTLADILDKQEISYIALDSDAAAVAVARNRGSPVHFGDSSRRDVLASIGAANAAAIVVTINNPAAVDLIVTQAKQAWPHVPVYARARDGEHARRLHQLGAALASPDTMEAALQLGEALLNGIGVPDEAARRIIDERREAEIVKALYQAP
ncbi:cation:proton antiporter [Vitreimonas flagellata]|uniref:cation:proton antiporter domain-containing protein n=1 Tax=Vitreimonas flagellata TaxID=2560861 RepID=UPI00107561F7|nr:cation:proton antiporter [Vitreimonas flagellata]